MIGGFYWIDFFHRPTLVGSDRSNTKYRTNMINGWPTENIPLPWMETWERHPSWKRLNGFDNPGIQFQKIKLKTQWSDAKYTNSTEGYDDILHALSFQTMDYPHFFKIIWILWISKGGKLWRDEDVMATDCDINDVYFLMYGKKLLWMEKGVPINHCIYARTCIYKSNSYSYLMIYSRQIFYLACLFIHFLIFHARVIVIADLTRSLVQIVYLQWPSACSNVERRSSNRSREACKAQPYPQTW